MAFLIPQENDWRNGYDFLPCLFSDLYSCLKEGLFDHGGLVFFLFFSIASNIGLLLRNGLAGGQGQLARLGYGVLLTDLFVLLAAFIYLEKDGNVKIFR